MFPYKIYTKVLLLLCLIITVNETGTAYHHNLPDVHQYGMNCMSHNIFTSFEIITNHGTGYCNRHPDPSEMSMGMILRSSKRFKKAKLTAVQSQEADTESQPIEFVPDSQANQ